MWLDLLSSLSLINVSGFVIIGVIVLILLVSLIVNASVRAKYRRLEDDLKSARKNSMPHRSRFLKKVFSDAEAAINSAAGELDFQALIEHRIKQDLRGALTAERFLKSASGLLIVLGLVGTFYGLTLSIGKLVALITSDVSGIAEMTTSLTKGLAGALSGMSVAFSTSLVGIVAAIIVVLLGVFSNLEERRNRLILRIEVGLDERCRELRSAGAGQGGVASDGRTVAAIETLGKSVAALQETVLTFDAALKGFADNTRDFQEFNLHLKDNIQRMSLGFADLSTTLKQQVGALTQHRPPQHRPVGPR